MHPTIDSTHQRPPSSDFRPQIITTQNLPTYPGYQHTSERDGSPAPPDFSPITPKTHPVLPAIATEQTVEPPLPIVDSATQEAQQDGETSKAAAIAPTEHVAAPPTQPFSGDDSIDGLALRAAISSLQFQKQKAKEDIEALSQIRQLALDNPERFAQELLEGRLKEKRHDFGNLQDVLNARKSLERDLRATDEAEQQRGNSMADITMEHGFPSMPGAQNVVRMPHINWDKYHIMGEPLEALHEQQRRWPGSAPFSQNKGREYSVAAPYSPFYDSLDGHQRHTRNISDGSPKGSGTPVAVVSTPVTSEHPYETRRNSKHQAQ